MDEQVSAQRARLEDEAEALVSAVAETDVTQGHSLWSSFAEAATVEAFCRSWLALQCRMMGGVRAGMVLLGPAERGRFRLVAACPEGSGAKTYQAEITVVNRTVDSASGTFGVRLEMPNPNHALPAGLACTVKFPVMP